jgi:CheY-like chemotaxis protein
MPVLDGFAFLDGFRGLPACADVPAVLMTGVRNVSAARRRIEATGVVLLMPKPLDLDTVLVALRAMAHTGGVRGCRAV